MNKFAESIKKAILWDFFLIVVFNGAMLYVFNKIDFLEWLYHYSQQYESAELDEIIPLFFTISVSLVIFTIRRFFELKMLLAETEQLSIRDHLTGLYNRRYMDDMFHMEVVRTKRTNAQFAVIIIDIDDFKQVNDKYGHNAGDQVLSQFSNIMLTVTRRVDIVSRWGGEEFLVLCPETHLDAATTTAKRLLTVIDEYEFDTVGHVTASMGVVIADENETFKSVVNRADNCLYEAKKKGKNCFVSASAVEDR